MRILVTGGSGFLGKHVVERLSKNHKVFSFDNLHYLCGGDPYANRWLGDVLSTTDLITAVIGLGITHIAHLAAFGRNLTCQDHPFEAWDINVTGTRNVLDVARILRVKRVVACSSNIVLSDKPTVYKATKQADECLVSMYASLGLSCMGIRPSNIYGKGQSKTEYQPCAFAGMDKGFARDGFFTVTGDGTQSRDWVHASDVARMFELALDSSFSGETLDACTGRLASINHVADTLKVPVKYVDKRLGDAQELVSDPYPAYNVLGFKSEIALDSAIEDAFPEVVKSRH